MLLANGCGMWSGQSEGSLFSNRENPPQIQAGLCRLPQRGLCKSCIALLARSRAIQKSFPAPIVIGRIIARNVKPAVSDGTRLLHSLAGRYSAQMRRTGSGSCSACSDSGETTRPAPGLQLHHHHIRTIPPAPPVSIRHARHSKPITHPHVAVSFTARSHRPAARPAVRFHGHFPPPG